MPAYADDTALVALDRVRGRSAGTSGANPVEPLRPLP